MGCFNRMAGCVSGIVLLLVLAAGALYFFGLARLDTMLADAVRREYMLPPSSEVVITRGSLLDTLDGEVKRFSVISAEAKLDGLVVEELEFLAEGIRFDLPRTFITGQAELREVANGKLKFRVSEQALEERWQEELASKGLSAVQVQLKADGVSVSAQIDLKLTKVRIGAKGNFEVDGTDKIKLIVDEVELGGASFGIGSFKAAFSELTPLIDLGQFKMSIAVDALKPRDGFLIVQAHSISLDEKLALDRERKAEAEARREQEEAERQQQAAEQAAAESEGSDANQEVGQDGQAPDKSDAEGK